MSGYYQRQPRSLKLPYNGRISCELDGKTVQAVLGKPKHRYAQALKS